MKWGMDIVGPLPIAPAQKTFMLALTDYFSKWIEADSFAQVKDREVEGFVWKNIVCRFGLPQEIVADNGSQFISHKFRNFCEQWKIKLIFSTPRYPQSNGQAESSKKSS
uniref:Integrase catalytic domain-containing protein n=1 Tax=Cannabis sativa TaxID=3483 RepID=A0A803PYS8_CANSA